MDKVYYYLCRANLALQKSEALKDKEMFDMNEPLLFQEDAPEVATGIPDNQEDLSGIPTPPYSDSSDALSSLDVAAQYPDTLFAEIVGIWQKQYKLLASDYAVTGWLLSVRPDIKSDASSNVKSHHKECVDHVIEKLYFNKTMEEQMEIKNTFWKEWNQFRYQMGPVFK